MKVRGGNFYPFIPLHSIVNYWEWNKKPKDCLPFLIISKRDKKKKGKAILQKLHLDPRISICQRSNISFSAFSNNKYCCLRMNDKQSILPHPSSPTKFHHYADIRKSFVVTHLSAARWRRDLLATLWFDWWNLLLTQTLGLACEM